MIKSLFILLALTHSLFALVSITPMEIGEKKGFHGNMALAFETKRGNTTKDNYKASAKISYDNNISYVVWSELSGEYGATNNQEDTNKQFWHLRYIHALTKRDIRTEYFGQIEENKFKLISNRTVGGAGFRFKIFEIFKNGKGYLGVGGLYENINYSTDVAKEDNIRFNSYFVYTTVFGDDAKFTYSIFYQPKVDEMSDYVQSNQLLLELQIYKELYLKFQLAYDYDSKPIRGVQNYDFTQTTSFGFRF